MKTEIPSTGSVETQIKVLRQEIYETEYKIQTLIKSLCPYERGDKLYLRGLGRFVDRIVIVDKVETAAFGGWQISCLDKNGKWEGRFEWWKISSEEKDQWRASCHAEFIEHLTESEIAALSGEPKEKSA